MQSWQNVQPRDTVVSNTGEFPQATRATMVDINAELPAVLRILVVEDNHDVADMLHQMLVSWGQKTLLARDGDRALELAAEYRPHVVLLDIGLPKMHGYELARRLRQLPGPRMTLIAVTGWGQEADRLQAKAAGIDYHIVKPAAPETLRALLESLSLDIDDRAD